MMKKRLSLLLVLSLLCIMLAGCGAAVLEPPGDGATSNSTSAVGNVPDSSWDDFSEEEAVEIPPYVQNYLPPTVLGDDWRNFNMLLGGDLYSLPAPLSAFTDNGWVIKNPDELPEEIYQTYIYLERNGEEITLMIQDYDRNSPGSESYFVVGIEYFLDDTVPFALAGGVTNQSTKDEFVAAWGEPTRVGEFGPGSWWYDEPGLNRYAGYQMNYTVFLQFQEDGQLRLLELTAEPYKV